MKEHSDSDEKSFLESFSSITNYGTSEQGRNIPLENAAAIANVFWRPQLTFHPYTFGDDPVEWSDLWPRGDHLASVLECFRPEDMRDVAIECCKLVLRCGPVRVLEKMLQLNIIGINDIFDNGRTLLHVACLSCNKNAVAFLCEKGINTKVKDNGGSTADQVCFDRETRRALPSKVSSGLSRSSRRKSSTFDRNVIFDMCDKPSLFDELQTYIQTQEFNICEDTNQQGDLLIHAAVKGDISQLALTINLVKVHGANLEAANRKTGMTPLCLAAKHGMDAFVDVLICVLGADPNAPNTLNGWRPLHFATKENHLQTVECLLKRGADVNLEFKLEDYCFLADDLATMHKNFECRKLIREERDQRCAILSHSAFLGNLSPKYLRQTDLFNIDSGGKTLLMAAAAGNRCDNLNVILRYKDCPINAQHSTSGVTALTYAALNGHLEAVQTLFNHGALAGIRDISGYLPLHYACKGGYELVVREFVSRAEGLTGLLEAFDLCPSDDLKALIRAGMEKRQMELVNPVLFECSMNGDAARIFCLLEDGDDVNPLTSSGDWPVYMAVGNGLLEVLKLLHERGGDIFRVHPQTASTLLHIACSRGLTNVTDYLLNFSKSYEEVSTSRSVATEPSVTAIDINAVNGQGLTGLQLAAAKGFAEVVKLLLLNGASSAVLGEDGSLYQCEQFEGVQAVIENHRKSRTDDMMLSIKDKKRFNYLQKHWQPKFDHNLRDRLGNTPLMSSCLAGRVPVVKFLLQTAIQDLGDVTVDFEKSMRLRYNSQSDSRNFLESYASTYQGGQSDQFESSLTDYSDHEGASAGSRQPRPSAAKFTSTPKTSREDLRKFRIPEEEFPNKHVRKKLSGWNEDPGPESGRRRTGRKYLSDSEVTGQEGRRTEGRRTEGRRMEGSARRDSMKKKAYAPSLASIHSASLSSLHSNQLLRNEYSKIK
ncbi:uncharacterized protein [Apostichopus japonicus]|uniref:uncharacterized protein isoform X2 n=1 Tax=Stichopus japonicus TaxID=307972 RepID=UPI003AB792DB